MQSQTNALLWVYTCTTQQRYKCTSSPTKNITDLFFLYSQFQIYKWHDKIAKLLYLGQISMLNMNGFISLLMSLRKNNKIPLWLLQNLSKKHLLLCVLYPIFTQTDLSNDSITTISHKFSYMCIIPHIQNLANIYIPLSLSMFVSKLATKVECFFVTIYQDLMVRCFIFASIFLHAQSFSLKKRNILPKD